MLDKLSLTSFWYPDRDYLSYRGGEKIADRGKLYKYMHNFDWGTVFVEPHKYSELVNARIPTTKIDLNPKYFSCCGHMLSELLPVFPKYDINPDFFNVTRADIAADMKDFPLKDIISSIHVKNITSESFTLFKGSTIYAGSDPKIRIYDKIKQLRYLIRKKGYKTTEYESELLQSGKDITRFEIQIRMTKTSLAYLVENYAELANYYDKLEFFNRDGNLTDGILHPLYRLIPRKNRNALEEFNNHVLAQELKDKYISGAAKWFNSDWVPF